MMNKYLFTCGDVNGIGPEIVIKTLNEISGTKKNEFYFACPVDVFHNTCKLVKPEFQYVISNKFTNGNPGLVNILELKNIKTDTGKATKESGRTAFNSIEIGVKLAINKQVDAVITAPISKTAINMAGINFPGHTEMLADWTNTKEFLMIFLSNKMNAALLTIHEPVKNVSRMINGKRIHKALDIIINTLKTDLNISNPGIAVLGFNPHAGENGIIGLEEIDTIIPALASYKNKEFLKGPFSPDAFFANRLYKKFDLILGMYHDQVLIPFKLLNFGGGVNYTAGLPIVRTSPDHGVAYDIAGKGVADPSSMIKSFLYAEKIVKNRRKNA